jgi:hypothetical protein
MNLDSIQIHLNSKYADKYVNNSVSDCEFNLPMIEIPAQHYIYISVQNATIPYTWYNIDSTNNTLIYHVNGVYYALQITQGNYNANQLASFLAKNMSGNFTVSYDIITNKFTFTNPNNFVINSTSTCLGILGFPQDELYSTSILKSLTSYTMVNLLNKSAIYIQSNLLTGNINNNSKAEGTILTSIPINCPPYSLITYNNFNGFKSNLYSNNISFIKIKIVDENHTLMNLNGCYWNITLQLDIVPL